MTGEIILYQTEDGVTVIRLQAQDGSVWLTQAQLADLFQTSIPNINQHIKAILDEDEQPESTIKPYLIVQTEGNRTVERQVSHYSLPMILAIGFRVRSPRGLQFRRWAAAALSEYLVKGFVMDDAKLKDPDTGYFEELLARIRDIRSSEKLFYRKVLDIYATSLDYDPHTETSQQFFATVQNKMHWATHGHTAAEVIAERADASKPFMGLQTTRPGGLVRKDDVGIAKNYLTENELQVLNRIVNLYIEYAELQALERKPMTMRDWIAKLDEFLKASGRPLLEHAGAVSADDARLKAEREYEHYRKLLDDQPQRVDADFENAAKELKKLPRPRKPRENKRRPE